MEFKEIAARASEIKERYDRLHEEEGNPAWGAHEFATGLVTDVGELTELLMAKRGYRKIADVDQKIAHELSDCLYSLLAVASELDVDLESEFLKTMDEVAVRIEERGY